MNESAAVTVRDSRDCDGKRRVSIILSEGKDLINCFSKQNNERFDQTLKKFADEPATRFFKCTKCKHTWREYK